MQLDKLRENIIANINESKLPIDAVYFVIKDIMQEVIEQYNLIKQQETQKEIKESEKNEKN